MNNFLLFLGALLVVTLAALFAVPHFVDWSVYRTGFEAQAGKLVGRDVRVGGRVNLRLLPAPYVSFENVRVADADGRFGEPPLRVEAFTLWLSIPPLLRGAIEASEVDLRRPEFLVRLREARGADGTAVTSAVSVLPMSIALRSVGIHDGTVRVVDGAGAETVRVEKVNGEFSAPSLEGPFRFRGTLQHAGREREVRLTTGRLEPGGALTIDGVVKLAEQATQYQLKGRVSEVLANPSFQGELTMRPTAERGKGRAPGKDGAGKDGRGDEPQLFYEMKGRLRLSASAAQLDDLAIQFEQAGRPQMLSGSATATFTGEPRVTAALDARWLDLDHIGGVDGKAGPQAVLLALGALAQGWMPAGIAADLRLGVEQATIGGDTVHRIELAAERAKDTVRLARLSAEVPGGGRLTLSGQLTGLPAPGTGPEALTFQGPLAIRGQNLKRFLAWLVPGRGPDVDDGVGAFSLAGDLTATRERIALSQAQGELGAAVVQGQAGVRLGARPEVTLVLDSDRLDLRPVLKGGGRLADVWRTMLGEATVTAATPAPAATAKASPAATKPAAKPLPPGIGRPESFDLDVRLQIGRLQLPDVELRDLSADAKLTDGATNVRGLRFTTANGLKVQTDGQIQRVDGRQRGALKTLIEVEQPVGLGQLLGFVDLPEAQVLESRGAELLPLRLAGILTLGVRGGPGFELLVDGSAQDSRATVLARFDQEPVNWRTGVVDLTGVIENARSSRLLAQLLPGLTTLSQGGGEPGRLSVRANGVPRTGVSTAIELESKTVEAGFSGVVILPGDNPSLNGEIGLKSADVADSLRLAGLKGGPALQGHDLVLHARVAAKGNEIQVSDSALRLGGASAEARGRIVRGPERLDVDLAVKAVEASLPALMALAAGTTIGGKVGGGKIGGGKPGEGRSGDGGAGGAPWPDEPIDLAAFGAVVGKIRLEAATLALGQTFVLRGATVEAEITPTAVDIKSIRGETLNGQMTASARIEKVAAGVTIQGAARHDGWRLERLAARDGDGASPVTGGASASLTFAGRGLTPRGIVATLTGQGSLQLTDVVVGSFGPEGLDAAVAQALPPIADDKEPTEVKLEPDIFKPVIAAELAKMPLALGTHTIPLELADGVVSTKALSLAVPRGRVKGTTFVDLASMRVDSEWTIETLGRMPARARPAEPPPAKGAVPEGTTVTALPVPGVAVVVAGPLAELANLDARLNPDALARELLVRRMELDLEALERVRKRKEAEEAARRQAKEEADRAKEAERLRLQKEKDDQEQATIELQRQRDAAERQRKAQEKASQEQAKKAQQDLEDQARTDEQVRKDDQARKDEQARKDAAAPATPATIAPLPATPLPASGQAPMGDKPGDITSIPVPEPVQVTAPPPASATATGPDAATPAAPAATSSIGSAGAGSGSPPADRPQSGAPASAQSSATPPGPVAKGKRPDVFDQQRGL